MGIQGLTRLISENVPGAIKTSEIKSHFGRKVAIDASMCIYQFMIAVRQQDGNMLMNEAGETTSHLMGFFYRTVRMVENGIKPVYVFDGKPPKMKSHELTKRKARKEDALEKLEAAKEEGTAEDMLRFTKRTVRVTTEHNEECKRLLKAMGIPYVNAPCEAEAQCAELVRAGKVYAAASEDMDTLTFGSPILMRHLTDAEQRKVPIQEFELQKVLDGLEFTKEQFIDLCILMGCDYVESIKGVGPHRALQMIKEYKTIDAAIQHLPEKLKAAIPENWAYAEARELFLVPEVTDGSTYDLKWEEPDVDEVVQFMVREKGFNEERIRKGCERLSKNIGKATQSRMMDFFKAQPGATPKKETPKATGTKKRGGAGADSKNLKKRRK
ncbi:flap endonuclease 1 [Gongronella butleri]|nr:flap endonuclease 1 [Gongronella butleri]